MSHEIVKPEPWADLSRWTRARIAVGRVGSSLPTRPLLDFSADHAAARDAVHADLDVESLRSGMQHLGLTPRIVRSRAADRSEYLRRPDLGRRLHPDHDPLLPSPAGAASHRLTVVIGDGLSALAPSRHAVPVLGRLCGALPEWDVEAVIATQARVALADEIGELRRSAITIMLLGERPGLKAPDSLGAYLTFAPRRGRTDAERNCVSNIHGEGLSYDIAAQKLAALVRRAHELGASGTSLKDEDGTGDDLLSHIGEQGLESSSRISSAQSS